MRSGADKAGKMTKLQKKQNKKDARLRYGGGEGQPNLAGKKLPPPPRRNKPSARRSSQAARQGVARSEEKIQTLEALFGELMLLCW